MSTGAEYRYVYDYLGQLTRENNADTNRTYVYTYDNAGNIQSKKIYGYTTATTVSTTLYDTINYTYDSTWGDKLTAYDGVAITYDAIGNPLTYYTGSASYTMTWTQGRRLATMSGNGQSLSFTYNADGIRTSKTVNGITHYYHLAGTQILSEEWTDANEVQHLIIYHYDANGQPIGMSYRNSTDYEGTYDSFLFVKNLQGDIIKVLDNEGNLLVSYAYDAWGNPTSTTYSNNGASTAAIYNPFRYRGYYYDSEIGLYYLNSRYYDPSFGRFINADDIKFLGIDGSVLSLNLYLYCSNNPISGYDPTGYWDWGKFWDGVVTAASIATGVVVGAVTYTAVTAATGNPIVGAAAAVAAGVATTGAINNAVNATYYTLAANDTSTVTPTSYNDGYVDRWDRLDYTKSQTGEKYYNLNAWRYYSEYDLHMYGWYATGWALDNDVPVVPKLANKFKRAEVEVNAWDDRWYVNIFTVAVGALGG